MEWVLVAVGVFSISGSVFNWEWFMNHRKARFFSNLLGRAGARIFYGILGIAFIVLGILFATGIIQKSG